jgi:phosphatidate cytidylyltransferase
MNLNLSKRVITSFFLLLILCLSLFVHKYFWLVTLVLVSVIAYIEFQNIIKKIIKIKKNSLILLKFLSILYLLFFIFSSYSIYKNPPIVLIFILLICIFSDTGGFIIGKLIGGQKLTKISPNKTVSGSVGSFIFSLIPTIIFLIIFNYTNNENFKINETTYTIILSLFLSLICQLGDLCISYFKRKANVKDTGSILPGHGGILDRVDGAIFVLPAAFILNIITL